MHVPCVSMYIDGYFHIRVYAYTVSTRRGRRPAICAAHRTSSLSFMLWACRPRWNEIGQVCGDEVCHVSGLGCHCEWYVWFVTTDYLNFKLKVVGSNN